MVHSAHGMRCIFAVGMMEHIVDLYNMHSTHKTRTHIDIGIIYLQIHIYTIDIRHSTIHFIYIYINAACKVNNSGALFCWAKTYTNTLSLTTRTLNGNKKEISLRRLLSFSEEEKCCCLFVRVHLYVWNRRRHFSSPAPSFEFKVAYCCCRSPDGWPKPCATWNGTSCSYLYFFTDFEVISLFSRFILFCLCVCAENALWDWTYSQAQRPSGLTAFNADNCRTLSHWRVCPVIGIRMIRISCNQLSPLANKANRK